MTDRVTVGNLRVAQVLYDFITNEALPGTDIDPDSFWAGVDKVVTDLSPQNQDLLARSSGSAPAAVPSTSSAESPLGPAAPVGDQWTMR